MRMYCRTSKGQKAIRAVRTSFTAPMARYRSMIYSAKIHSVMIFIKSALNLQYPHNEDFNSQDQEGVGYYQVTQKQGQRCSAARAYLEPAYERSNLTVICNAHTEKVLFEENRASGVRVHIDGDSQTLKARREVVLSAGAFQSPQLLMLSGIGPGTVLQEFGIEPMAINEEVGAHLQDHIDYSVLRRSHSPESIGLHFGFVKKFLPALFQYLSKREGMITSNIAEAGGFIRSRPDVTEPDLQFVFLPALVDDHGRKRHLGSGFSCHVCVLRPESRGTVSLTSADPMAPPRIDPQFLSAPGDLDLLLQGAKAVHRVFDTPPLSNAGTKDVYPVNPDDEAALIDDIRNRADTVYHPVGTCRMNDQEGGVV